MARPAKFDRNEVVATALDLVWRDGVERSSVKHLAEQLDMTRSSFYNAFGSRDDFIRELMQAYGKGSPDRLLGEEVTGDVIPVIEAVFREMCRQRGNDPERRGCLIVNLLCDRAATGDELGAQASAMIDGMAARLAELVNLAKANGEIAVRADDSVLALALQTLLLGLNVLAKTGKSEEELWQVAKLTLVGLGIPVTAN